MTVIHEMISFNVPAVTERTMPDVPLAPGIDLSAILSLDPRPVFVVRPLGVIGGLSDNGLEYDDFLLSEIERQTLAKRPPARLGHVADEDKSWRVPDSVGYWVGALRDGDILWGKCYILPGNPFHGEIKVKEAIGSELSNSIYGDASFIVNDMGNTKCVGLALESIDFVPPERAALKALGGEFSVTSEMSQGEDSMAEQEAADRAKDEKPEKVYEMLSEADRQKCAEMFLSQCDTGKFMEMAARLKEVSGEELTGKISEAARKAIAEAYVREAGFKMVKEDAAPVAETVAEMTSMKSRLAEMESTIKRYQRDDFERAVDAAVDAEFADWHVTTDKGKETVKTLKGNLRFRALAEMAGMAGGHTPDNIQAAMELATPHIRPLKEMALANLSGPNAIVGTTSGGGTLKYGWDAQTGRYSEDAVAAALARTNMLSGREQGGTK